MVGKFSIKPLRHPQLDWGSSTKHESQRISADAK